MNHRQSPPPPKLQPVSPEALLHIAALVERDNIGLPQRCARYRRRASIRRTAGAACLLALFALGADTAYANPPLYTGIDTCGQIDNTHTCDTINTMLNQL